MATTLGGQTALKLAEKLHRYGIPVIGTSFEALDMAEDRERFSSLLRDLGIPYPAFGAVNNAEEAIALSRQLGFPLLVRLGVATLGSAITGARGISPSGNLPAGRQGRNPRGVAGATTKGDNAAGRRKASRG